MQIAKNARTFVNFGILGLLKPLEAKKKRNSVLDFVGPFLLSKEPQGTPWGAGVKNC